MIVELTIWILALPFAVFLITGVFNGRVSERLTAYLSTIAILVSCVLSFIVSYIFLNSGGEVQHRVFGTWMAFSDSLQVNAGFILDSISVMMLVVITTVSLMVQLYSLGYMKGENGFGRYFTFLSLFTFSMLGLVLATNLIQMYIFWELVGASSFLLISFYYNRPAAIAAAKKAFVVTRFADFGLLLGILIYSFETKSFDFILNQDAEGVVMTTSGQTFLGLSPLFYAMVLMFMGGAGKSAMFPFHVWLPDAMEGPTPVSALIHAATMVVAGVYLVARMFNMYVLAAPEALAIIAFIGAFTSLIAALMALVQTDIKKVLAYSTISQIGYMMLSLGVSGSTGSESLGFSASMFHLFTHAFFKALLFLCAGSIIHAVHSNEMSKMGGLRKSMPVTHITFLIGALAIAGIPPFAGFFSKDEILVATLAQPLYFGVALFVAGLTAFYMFRMYFLVFWNKTGTTAHESPSIMTIPLWILAIGAVFAGFVPFTQWVTLSNVPIETVFHWDIALASVGVAAIGILFALRLYKTESDQSEKLRSKLSGVHVLLTRKFYLDELYLFITRTIVFKLIAQPIAWFDRNIVDGFMDLTGNSTVRASRAVRNLQSGNIHQYAYVFVTGALIIVILVLFIF